MQYPTYSIILHVRKRNDGSQPLYLRATYQGKSKYFPLNIHCNSNNWNPDERRVSKALPGYKETNDLLRSIEQRAADALYDFKRSGVPFSFDRFEQMVFVSSSPILTRKVSEYCRQRSAELNADNRAGNAALYDTLAKVIDSYKKGATFADIGHDWILKFEKHLRVVRGNSDGGVSATMRTLRAICNHAKEQNAPADWQPFAKYKIKRPKQDGGGRALPMADFRAIEAAPVQSGTYEALSKDLFVLSFYLRGANLTDLARLTRKNIIAGRIEFVRWKTRNTKPKLYSIPIVPEVSEVFERYSGRESEWLLPVLDGVDGNDEKACKNRIDNYTGTVNECIRRIAARVGVDTARLKFYSARHTGATALGMAGVNPRIIQEYLGHEDFKTTQLYLKKHSPAEVDEAADILRR